MKKLLAILVLGLLLSSNAYADNWTYLFYKQKYVEDRTAAKAYLWGLQTGYRVGQQAAGAKSYCMPENFSLTLENVENIIDDQAKRMNNADGEWLPIIFHLGMVHTFPCQ